jgi:anti-anti-sigma factor
MTGEDYTPRRVGPHDVITLPAEIDAINAEEVRQALVAAASRDAAVLVIDMSQTTFCDSAGVNAIITASSQATAAATRLRLVAPRLLRIFTIIGVDQLIPLYQTLEAALAEPGPGQPGPPDPCDETERSTASADPQTPPRAGIDREMSA